MKKLALIFIFILIVPFAQAQKLELTDIVVGVDFAEPDAPIFPMRALGGYGEVFLEPLFSLKMNNQCIRNHIVVDQKKETVSCLPDGDATQAFVFARFSKTRGPVQESGSGWLIIFLDYDMDRVKLTATPNVETERFEYNFHIERKPVHE